LPHAAFCIFSADVALPLASPFRQLNGNLAPERANGVRRRKKLVQGQYVPVLIDDRLKDGSLLPPTEAE